MTEFYFALAHTTIDRRSFGSRPGQAHLVALHHYRTWAAMRDVTKPRKWCLDSGAFEAFSQGKPLTYEMWHEVASVCDADEIFGLDVIGDPKATRANVERAWADGIRAIPTFHYGSPWEYLEWAATSAPKLALGGVARRKDTERMPWITECFRRAWPVRAHGFGIASASGVNTVPFHTVDASSWFAGARRFKRHTAFSKGQLGKVKGVRVPSASMDDLAGEIDAYLQLEKWAQFKWRKEMELLSSLPTDWFVKR